MSGVLVLVFLLGLGGFLLLGLRKSGNRVGNGPMSCGACGYQVQGLQSLNCPECGADLREVGIVPLATRGKWSTPVVLIVIAVVSLVLFWLMVGIPSQTRMPVPPTPLPANPVPVTPAQPAPAPAPATP